MGRTINAAKNTKGLVENLERCMKTMKGQLDEGKGYSPIFQQYEARLKDILYARPGVPLEVVERFEKRYETEIEPRLKAIVGI